MREILFKAKRKYNDEWVQGLYATGQRSNGEIMHMIITENQQSFFVIRETIGQYTGLTDKNGTKIFEGDIVNCRSYSGLRDFNNRVVNWDEFFLSFKTENNALYGDGGLEYEIVGNIHDNPELLEVKENA